MSIIVVLILFAVLFMACVTAVLLAIGPIMLLQPHRRTVDYYRRYTSILEPSDLDLPCEPLSIATDDGITLSGWLIRAAEPKGTVFYLHGVSECKIVGLPMAKMLHDRGFHVFLYDSRRHGESGGSFCTYGYYEKRDASKVMDVVSSLAGFEPGKIALFGSSMGAAVAIQVAALDKRVVALVAESGFATLRTVFDDYQRRMIKLPWHYLRNIVIKRSEHLAGFKANAVSPLEAVREVHVPIFILHGTADDRIASGYSEMVYGNANPPKQLWLIEGARHGDMAEVGGADYYERIGRFFEDALGPPAPLS